MKIHRFSINIIILFTLALAVVTPAHAQFGGLINKAKKKIDSQNQTVNVETTASTNANTNVGSDSAGGSSSSRQGGAAVVGGAKLGEPGSIGLSKSPIDPKNWQAAKYETEFTVNDNIYAIIFFGEPISKLGVNNDYKEMDVAFNDGSYKLADNWGIPVKPEQMNASVITLPINPAPADVFNEADQMAAGRFLYMAKRYDNQKGTMKLMAGNNYQAQTVIAFDFTNANEIADARLQAMQKAIYANSDKANASNPLPKAGMNNPTLARQFAALVDGSGHEWKLLKLIIASPEWQIERHEISGAILNRYLVTRNVVKDPAGNCRILSIVFQQNYNGSGYGRTFMDVRTGRSDDYAVSCDKAR